MRASAWSFFAVLLFGLCLEVVACSGNTQGKRINTLPTGDDVYSDMWTLASMTDELVTLMKDSDANPLDAVALLERMESTAERLRGDDQRKKHPLLEDNIDSFYAEVKLALEGAKAEPPNYFYAGKVSGACVYCHDPDGGLRRRN